MSEGCSLIIIGGGEDKKGEKGILKEVCHTVKHKEGYLLIATVATDLPKEVWNEYRDIFYSLGIKKVEQLDIQCREDAFKDYNIELIEKAALVFFTGGDQLKITGLLGGTPLYKSMKKAYKNGCVYVGTSAGASVMSDTMIVQGMDEESPRKCTLKMAPGLGLLNEVIIDQHFAQRGRLGRLLAGIAQNPQCLGVGIDEDTAIIVNEDLFHVIGSGAVYVIDGMDITYSNVSEQYPDEVLSMFHIKMHILKQGDSFDISSREPIKEENHENNRS